MPAVHRSLVRKSAATVALALYTVLTGDVDTAADLGIEDLAKRYADRGLDVNLVHRDITEDVVER